MKNTGGIVVPILINFNEVEMRAVLTHFTPRVCEMVRGLWFSACYLSRARPVRKTAVVCGLRSSKRASPRGWLAGRLAAPDRTAPGVIAEACFIMK